MLHQTKNKQIKHSKGEAHRLVLLDAHAILHRAYHALPDFSSSKGEPTGALYGLAAMLIKIINDLKPDYIAACYDLPGPTYRHEAYEGYKAGRKKTDGDLVAQIIRSRDICTAFSIPIYDKPGFEADDMLGTIVEKMKGEKDLEIVIASGDMDTLQLVTDKKVQVYTLKKGINDTILYDEEAVLKRFGFSPLLLPDYKGLRGDPSDNIIGIAGIGEKTATVLIQKFGSIEEMYKKLKKSKAEFEKVGIKPRIIDLLLAGEEEAIFSKMLGTIRRDAPIEFTLPSRLWRETVEPEKIFTLFSELDFRTLSHRVKELFGLVGASSDPINVPEAKRETGSLEDQKEVSVMYSLLNSNVSEPTLDEIFDFTKTKNISDARATLLKEIDKRELTRVFEEIEKPLISVIGKMEKRGIKVNEKYLQSLGKEYHLELESLQKKIWKHAGVEFNINSPKQMGEILFVKMGLKVKNQKKTGTGALSTKESELEKYRELHPIIGLILEYRELGKLLGTYIDTIPGLLHPDSRLHARFLSIGASTGRMASKDPNLQNIPNKTELGRKIRRAFIPEKGFELVAFDYSQIELRIAAFLSEDPKLLEIFKVGEDVHTAVASQVFNVPKDKVDKEMRRKAKVINFGIIYGMGVNALKQNLGTSREEAQIFYNEYFKKFSGLAIYLDKIKAETSRKGYTETLIGRRRYFEGIKSHLPFIRAAAERMAINAPIQGTGADITKLAMIKVDEYIQKEKFDQDVYLLLQVHDELVYEIKKELVASVAPKIKKIMETAVSLKETKGVVCATEVHVGENWGEMKPLG